VGLDLRTWEGHIDGQVTYTHPSLAEPLCFEQRPSLSADTNQIDGTFRRIWPAALSFGSWLCAHPAVVKGKSVLELGAGSGVAGIICAALGASEVWLTDLPSALPLIEANLMKNRGSTSNCNVWPCKWGDEGDFRGLRERAGRTTFDIILASELVYKNDHVFRALVETMRAFRSASGQILLVYEFRGDLFDDLSFFELMNEHFDVETVALDGYALTRAASQSAGASPAAATPREVSETECEEYLYIYSSLPPPADGAVES
jgi:predicted nicotinamide N-methyase